MNDALLRTKLATAIGLVLADRLEELGSRWCEPIRASLKDGPATYIEHATFELTDID